MSFYLFPGTRITSIIPSKSEEISFLETFEEGWTQGNKFPQFSLAPDFIEEYEDWVSTTPESPPSGGSDPGGTIPTGTDPTMIGPGI